MKKILTVVLTLALICSLTACFAEDATGLYTVFNSTGENLTELFIYPTGSEDKGENLAVEFKSPGELTWTGASDTVLTVEFTTESGYNAAFTTLHIETAPVDLLAADALTGATPISFFAPQATGVYSVFNSTGENLAELYIYPTDSEDKGENLAASFVDGAEISWTGTVGTVLTIEFITESGYTGIFNTLHIETAPVYLLSADAMTGATQISFRAPKN